MAGRNAHARIEQHTLLAIPADIDADRTAFRGKLTIGKRIVLSGRNFGEKHL